MYENAIYICDLTKVPDFRWNSADINITHVSRNIYVLWIFFR